jgi:plasmid maintenance system antidote protein VapI
MSGETQKTEGGMVETSQAFSARMLKVTPSMMSQVLAGKKHFSYALAKDASTLIGGNVELWCNTGKPESDIAFARVAVFGKFVEKQ